MVCLFRKRIFHAIATLLLSMRFIENFQTEDNFKREHYRMICKNITESRKEYNNISNDPVLNEPQLKGGGVTENSKSIIDIEEPYYLEALNSFSIFLGKKKAIPNAEMAEKRQKYLLSEEVDSDLKLDILTIYIPVNFLPHFYCYTTDKRGYLIFSSDKKGSINTYIEQEYFRIYRAKLEDEFLHKLITEAELTGCPDIMANNMKHRCGVKTFIPPENDVIDGHLIREPLFVDFSKTVVDKDFWDKFLEQESIDKFSYIIRSVLKWIPFPNIDSDVEEFLRTHGIYCPPSFFDKFTGKLMKEPYEFWVGDIKYKADKSTIEGFRHETIAEEIVMVAYIQPLTWELIDEVSIKKDEALDRLIITFILKSTKFGPYLELLRQ